MSYKISDAVAMRMIQIFQEAVIFGVDGADLLRQVRLVPMEVDGSILTLDPEYAASVEAMHTRYLADIESKKSEKTPVEGKIFG